MADNISVAGKSGRPFELQKSQEEGAANAGLKEISSEQAASDAKAWANIDDMNRNWAPHERFLGGVFSGATLGLGPALLSKYGLADKGDIAALGTSGAYQAGNIAGMIAPAVLTGGESLAAEGAIAGAEAGGKGLIARALANTPAGIVSRAGASVESLAGKVLPSAGVMGKIAKPALQMAARGSAEGALIGASQAASENIIQDKPLTWSSIAASSADGALMGGVIGAGIGSVSGVFGALKGAAVRTAASSSASAESSAAKYARFLGAGDSDITAMASSEKGIIGKVKAYHDILDGAETTPRAIMDVAQKNIKDASEVSSSILKTLDKDAPNMVPRPDRLLGRVSTELDAKFGNTFLSKDSTKLVSRLESDLTKPNLTWTDWGSVRTQLEDARDLVSGVRKPLYDTAIKNLDAEFRLGMESASESIGSPGLAESYHSSIYSRNAAKELNEFASGKFGKTTGLGRHIDLSSGDMSTIAYGSLSGHPIGAAAIVAGKRVAKHIMGSMEPVIAEAAYRNAIGAEAGAAKALIGDTITSKIKTFLSSSVPAATYVAVKPTRENYDKAMQRTSALIDASHAVKVQRMAEQMSNMGHPELANEVIEQYKRASEYIRFNMPSSPSYKQSGSLGKMPSPIGLNTKEFKALKIDNAVKNPMSVMDSIMGGKVSRDEIRAIKYVYPALHSEIVYRTSQELLEMKEAGKFLPADKIAYLGTLLDAPIDSKLDKGFIGAVQSALTANNQPQPKPGQSSGAAPVTDSSSYQTPNQSSIQA